MTPIKALYIFILFTISTVSIAQVNNESTIRQLLQEQTQAWNNGDIEGFMNIYWKNDSLLYVSKNGVTYGWQHTLNNYKESYPNSQAMGQLRFTIITIQKLSSEVYNVVGKWQLTREAGNLQGHFTLLWRKINGKWCIVQDHSS